MSYAEDDTTTTIAHLIHRAYEAHKPGPSPNFTLSDARTVAMWQVTVGRLHFDARDYRRAVATVFADDQNLVAQLFEFIDTVLASTDYDPFLDVDECWDEHGNFIMPTANRPIGGDWLEDYS